MNTLPTGLQQQSDQYSETTETCAIWGDEINKENNNTIRICFQNINGFGYNKDNKYKLENIRELITTKQIDIMAMAETNDNWRKVQRRDSIWNQTRVETTPYLIKGCISHFLRSHSMGCNSDK